MEFSVLTDSLGQPIMTDEGIKEYQNWFKKQNQRDLNIDLPSVSTIISLENGELKFQYPNPNIQEGNIYLFGGIPSTFGDQFIKSSVELPIKDDNWEISNSNVEGLPNRIVISRIEEEENNIFVCEQILDSQEKVEESLEFDDFEDDDIDKAYLDTFKDAGGDTKFVLTLESGRANMYLTKTELQEALSKIERLENPDGLVKESELKSLVELSFEDEEAVKRLPKEEDWQRIFDNRKNSKVDQK